MTCIAALVDKDGRVWMAGDSATTYGEELRLLSEGMPKVSKRVDEGGTVWMLGTAGRSRLRQVIALEIDLPKAPLGGEDVLGFLVKEFIPRLRDTLDEVGFMEKEKNADKMKGAILIGLKGRLFMVDGNFCVIEEAQPFTAIGSGENVAFGVLYATQDNDPEKRLYLALEAAEARTTDVRRLFMIRHT